MPCALRSSRPSFVAGLALLAVATPLRGQIDDAATLSLDSLLNVPVTAAARYEQTASTAPSSVSIVTGDEIRALGLRTVGEILALVPGFYVTDDRNYLGVGVRGMGLPGDYNNRILLLLNGHPINDPQYGSAYLGTELALDPATLERLEVVRGPGSALYGDNAMFAVVNVVTRGVESFEGIAVRSRAGSHGRRGADLELATSPGRGVELHVAGTWESTDGEDIPIPGMEPRLVTRDQDADEYRSVAAEATWRHWRVQGRLSDREKAIGTGAWATAFDDPRSHTIDRLGSVELIWDRPLSPTHSARISASADRFVYRGFYTDAGDPELYTDGSDTRRLMLEGQWIWDPAPAMRFIVGGDYRDHYRQHYWNGYAGERSFDEDVPFRSWSVFALGERRLTPDLTLVVGGRHDRLSDGGRSTTPRAGLVYDDGTTTLKALAGTAFRFPSFYERFFEDVTSDYVAATDLDPEHVTTYELVAGRRLGRGLHAGVSLFRSEITGLINTMILDNGATTFVNGEDVETLGMEASIEARPTRGTTLRAAYTWVHAHQPDTNEDAPNVPEHVAQVHGFQQVTSRMLVGMDGRYESGRETLWGARTGQVLLINGHLQAPELLPGLTPGLRIRNLFDRTYGLPGGLEMPTDRVTQPGRQWSVELSYRF